MSGTLETIKIINRIQEIFSNDESKYLVFRGLSNEKWNIESGAARRLRNNGRKKQADFIKYHQVLLDDVKKGNYKGFHDEVISNMCELEILAQIQHLGGATCLTDFSTNLLIALWFATEPNKENGVETDAKLYAINLKSLKNIDMFQDVMIIKNGDKKSIRDLLTYECRPETKKEHLWYWKPRIMNGRINNQNSIFIFGLPAFSENLYEKIDIASNLKSIIRQELREYFGINVNTVYPDLMGFSVTANNHNAMFNDFFSMSCMDIAQCFLNEKNFNNCQRYIDDMNECIKNQSKCNRRNTDKCRNSEADLYYLSGKCDYSRVEYEYYEAEKNHTTINYARLINSYIVAIEKLKLAISKDTKYAFDCMCTMINCFYNIILCNQLYLENDNSDKFELLLDTKESYLTLISKLREDNLILIDKSEDLLIEFSILELSIFSMNIDIFNKQVKTIETMFNKGCMYVNCKLLLEYYKVIGKYVFQYSKNADNLTQKDITYKINKFENDIKTWCAECNNIFTFSTNWDYHDMNDWLSAHFEQQGESQLCKSLQIFSNETEILQNNLMLEMFEKDLPY